VDKTASRTAPVLVVLDSRGKQLSSEELAQFIDDHQTRGTQQLLFAVGGADGFPPKPDTLRNSNSHWARCLSS